MVNTIRLKLQDLDCTMTIRFTGPKAFIDQLKRMIKATHAMDPNYSESEDNERHYAHPSWAMNLNHPELADKNKRSDSSPIDSKPDGTTSCQTPRECQTRSYAPLKKSSTIRQTNQHLSATAELDLPQSGSEDDDETWLTEPTGCKTTHPTKVAAEATNAAEACWAPNPVAMDPFRSHPKTQPVAEPDLPRTTTATRGCDLPGFRSQDDDEDSSPIVQKPDRAEHPRCSSYRYTLTQSGFLMATLVVGTDSKEWVTTGSTNNTSPNQLNLDSEVAQRTSNNRKATPASHALHARIRHLTIISLLK